MDRFGPNHHKSLTTHLHWNPRTFFGNKRVIRRNLWVKLAQKTSKVILHICTEFQWHFSWTKRVIKMNPWVYLIRSNAKVSLPIPTKFQGHFSWGKRVSWVELVQSSTQGYFPSSKKVIRVNQWVELVQRTTKVILNISTEFQEHFS